MPSYHADLLPDCTYHIFNRAVGNEQLFKSDDNYHFFLRKFKKYILPVAEPFAWCLLPNHFHFLIRIKNTGAIEAHYKEVKTNKILMPEIVSDFLMECFSNLQNSYAKAYNKVYNRKGALFIDYMRRVTVDKDSQFGATIFYIHKNPVHHGYCKEIDAWKWSSYLSYKFKRPTTSAAAEALNWFGDKENFLLYHNQPVYLKNALVIE